MSDEYRRFRRGRDAGLDNVAQASGQLRNQMFFAQMEGATNLLHKAMTALETGDAERVDQLVARVAAMDYDDREWCFVGVRAATQLVHDEVYDAYQECDEDDSSWLDAALAAWDRVTGPGRDQLASSINGYVLQDFFDLPRPETRRIRAAVGDAPLEVDHVGGPEASIAERTMVVRSLLEATLAFHLAYAHEGSPAGPSTD